MSAEKKIWQYELRGIPNRGEWATIFIREDGIFTAVSSFGNYGYFWGNTGCNDVREFFLRCGRDTDYFLKKLSPKQEINADKSIDALKLEVRRMRREKEIDEAQARELYDTIEDYSDDWEGIIRSSVMSVIEYDTLADLTVMENNYNAVAFCEHILPALAGAIRLQLESERSPKP